MSDEKLASPPESTPKVRSREHQARQRLDHLSDRHAVEIATAAAANLRDWGADDSAVLAALLNPVLAENSELEPELRFEFGDGVVDLLSWHVSFREKVGDVPFDGTATSQAESSLLLRRLLLLIYTGWPRFARVRVALAFQATLLDNGKVSYRRAAETWSLFAPVLEALGWWRLRRRWLQQVGALIRPNEVQRLRLAIEQHKEAREQAAADVIARLQQASREVGLNLEITSRKLSAPVLAMREGRLPVEDLARSPVLRILCDESDCYRALGLAHALGRPVPDRLQDLIAAQKPNGYRALHTAVTVRGAGGRAASDTVIDIRICSPQMLALNEEGLIGADLEARESASSLWSRRLERLQEWATTHGIRTDLHKYLDDVDAEVRKTIFVFSPLGEIFLLSADSTVLDYAYSVHTWLGDHTVGARVNSQQVELGTRLQAGDIVRIIFDASSTGPDLSWLPIVVTKRAKNRLRHSLTERYRRLHPGAEILLGELMRRVDFYRDERNYPLVITAGRLDAFLNKLGQVRNLSQTEIFERIESGELATSKIVRQLISDELANTVSAEEKEEKYPLHRIEFCDFCRPCPGEKIVAVKGKNLRKPSLRVHRPDCRGLRAAKRRDFVSIEWKQGGVADHTFFKLEIQAQDRYRILLEVLEACFTESKTYLYEVLASGGPRGSAQISLVLSVNSMEQLSRIQERLAGISHVSNVLSLPQAADLFTAQNQSSPINPYTEQQIFADWMFFDREGLLRDLMTWLEPENPRRYLIVHGLSGMGKTELARRLMHQRIRGRNDVSASLIDLQWLAHFSLDGFCRFLGEQLSRSQGLEMTAPPESGDAGPWLHEVIGRLDAALEARSSTLLVVLDELNYLLEQGIDGNVFKILKAVFRQSRRVKWLTIVQDPYFIDSRLWGPAKSLFQGCDSELVPPLPGQFARKLVVAPITRCGYRISRDRNSAGSDVPDQIVRYCGGNPQLLQAFCRQLVNLAQNRGAKDLGHLEIELVAGMLRSRPRQHLGHLDRYWELAPDDAKVLSTLAHATHDGRSASLADLTGECRGVERPSIARSLKRLESLGLVEVERHRVKRYFVRSLLLQHRMRHLDS